MPVSQGETTSNETIKWWVRRNKELAESDKSKSTSQKSLRWTRRKRLETNVTLSFKHLKMDCVGIRWKKQSSMSTESTIIWVMNDKQKKPIDLTGKSKT